MGALEPGLLPALSAMRGLLASTAPALPQEQQVRYQELKGPVMMLPLL